MAAAETAATLASGAAAAAAVAGWPPAIVITCALMGGVVSVWLDHRADVALTPKWLIGAIWQVMVSSAAGVAFSALALAVLPAYPLVAPLAQAPQWALAGVIAALIHRFAPMALRWVNRKADQADQGGSNA